MTDAADTREHGKSPGTKKHAWRRNLLTRPLLSWYRKRIPPMSDTEPVQATIRELVSANHILFDQGVVDGVVNGSGAAARGTGSALRPTQSGKVSQYGALLFAAAALAALILVLVNS